MSAEEWRPVRWQSKYEVSSMGRVRSNSRAVPRILKPQVGRSGYAHVALGRQLVNISVHSLVADAFLGEKLPHLVVRHLDGNKLNNAAANLAYGTVSQNALDSIEHGTHAEARKTHCEHGHAFDGANTRYYRRPSGRISRACRACGRRYAAERSKK